MIGRRIKPVYAMREYLARESNWGGYRRYSNGHVLNQFGWTRVETSTD